MAITMTAAQKKVQDYRDMMNKGRQKILAKDFSSCCYLYENVNGKPCVVGYAGRAKKRAFNYRYNSLEQAQEKILTFMAARSERQKAGKRTTNDRTLEVGDVLSASWGYEQTNIDYYMVVGLIGKSTVEVVEIGKHVEQGKISMTGTCSPDITKIIGKPIKRRANGDSIKINSSVWPSKMEPIDTINGVKVYTTSSWSSYA